MDRRKFFSLFPALAALPAICKNLLEPKLKTFWAGTIIPRSTPWEELEASERRAVQASGKTDLWAEPLTPENINRANFGYRFSYHFVNRKGDIVATSPDLKSWRMTNGHQE